MRVVRVIPLLDFGGVEQVLNSFSVNFANHFNSQNLKIVVLGNGGRISNQLISLGFDVEILNEKIRIPNIRVLIKLYRIFRAFNPDIVHCQTSEANFHGLVAAKLSKVPVRIGEEVGFPNHHSFWRFIFKGVYACATKVIAISNAVKDKIISLGETSAKKIEVIYNPIGDEFLKIADGTANFQIPIEKDLNGLDPVLNSNDSKEIPFVFITTCRLVKIKNLERLIRAFSIFTTDCPTYKPQLWVVGDGPERAELDRVCFLNKCEKSVLFFGVKSDVKPFLSNADVFVLPSLSEGSSVALAEAMCFGLPSIVTKIGGAPEILGGSKSGILVDPEDISSIVDALKSMAKLNFIELSEISLRAKSEARRFSAEIYVNKLFEIYYER